jgi:hypothetical protein
MRKMIKEKQPQEVFTPINADKDKIYVIAYTNISYIAKLCKVRTKNEEFYQWLSLNDTFSWLSLSNTGMFDSIYCSLEEALKATEEYPSTAVYEFDTLMELAQWLVERNKS